MNYKTLTRNIGFVSVLAVTVSFTQIFSQFGAGKCIASEERKVSKNRKMPCVCQVSDDCLTPKEKQILELGINQFFQLQSNHKIYQSSVANLCVAVDVFDQLYRGKEPFEGPLRPRRHRLISIAKQFSLKKEDFSPKAEVTPKMIVKASRLIQSPVLYVEIGDRFFSLGPIDIIRRVIYAKPDEDEHPFIVLDKKSLFGDRKLISQMTLEIDNYDDILVVCFNSSLKRMLFSLPENEAVNIPEDTDRDIQNYRKTAVLKIAKKRLYRNVGIALPVFSMAALGILCLNPQLLPTIIQKITAITQQIGSALKQYASSIAAGCSIDDDCSEDEGHLKIEERPICSCFPTCPSMRSIPVYQGPMLPGA
ncbi:MAG: hypothetical protein LBB11_03685 [Puniceicoccales bacterium]|nr:hypothetical protein [Puniceicoccales bacterium]